MTFFKFMIAMVSTLFLLLDNAASQTLPSTSGRISWNPTLYAEAPPSAVELSRDAARQLLQAQCEIGEAMKGFDEQENQYIKKSSDNLYSASKKFAEASKQLDAMYLLTTESNIVNINAIHEELRRDVHLDLPNMTSYKSAILILSLASERVANKISSYKYNGVTSNDIMILKNLKENSSALAKVFVSVSIITKVSLQ